MRKGLTRVINKISTLLLMGVMTLTLTGCGAELKSFVQTDLGAELDGRFTENQGVLDGLYSAGLISEDVYTQTSEHIKAQRNAYLTTDSNGAIQADIQIDSKGYFQSGPIVSSVSEYRALDNTVISTYKDDNGAEKQVTKQDQLNEYIISSYLTSTYAWNMQGNSSFKWNTWQYKTNKSGKKDVNPIIVVDKDKLTFTDNIDCDIYTLRPDVTSADGTAGIDGVIEMIQKYIDDDGNVTDYTKLNNYFSLATYTNDVTDTTTGNIIHSKGSRITMRDLLNIDSLVVESREYDGADIPADSKGDTKNRPGYDMLVKQLDEPVLKIKFEEFDKDAVDRFKAAMGIDSVTNESTQKWVYYKKDGVNRAYLIEYPVYYIKGLQTVYEGNNEYSEAVLDKSDLAVNLKTGRMMNYKYDSDGNIESSCLISNANNDPYLTMKGAINANADSQSAFFVSGVGEARLTNDFSQGTNTDILITTGRIILRDYLEATYAPGFQTSDNEDLVVFGRKIRFTNIKTTTTAYSSDRQNSMTIQGTVSSSATGVMSNVVQGSSKPINVKSNYIMPNTNKISSTISSSTSSGLNSLLEPPQDYIKNNGYMSVEEMIKNMNAGGNSTTYIKGGEATLTPKKKSSIESNRQISLYSNIPTGSGQASGNMSALNQTIIRFDKNEYCAVFVDKEGVQIPETPKLNVDDFCDVNEIVGLGTSAEPTIVRPTAKGEADQTSGAAKNTDSKSTDALPYLATDSLVTISTRFPGTIVGTSDYTRDTQNLASSTSANTTHQVFYAVATKADLFQTALFSSWVNSESETASLKWWDGWLSDNSYLYNLDSTTLDDYLYNNFSYELSQSGIVILDLDTISKIQNEYDDDSKKGTNRYIRTFARVLGWGLICYAIILVMCWLIDTNIDFGYDLTNKLTLGKWIPVKYSEDIPTKDLENRKYITFSGLIAKSIVFIAVGILLVTTDVFSIVLFFIKTLGSFASGIIKMITGIR